MQIVTPNSEEFWPGALVPLSTATSEATSGMMTEEAPTPTSSAMVKSQWTSTGATAPARWNASIAASMIATPALSSRWRELMKPLSRNSGCGSIATMSPISMPSAAVSSALAVGASMRSSTKSQPVGCVSRSSLKVRSEEHTSELQSLMRISYAVLCLKKNNYQYLLLCYT